MTVKANDFTSLHFYAGEEHQPFHYVSGANAALLIHGFPGTPAEMRMLGRTLWNDSWTVQGILLPGFGHDISHLEQYAVADWLEAIDNAIERMASRHEKVVVVGNSVGAALSAVSAVGGKVDGLVLLSPFLRLDNRLIDALFPILPVLKRNMQPFEKANFDDPQVRESIKRFLPDADLDDETVLEMLRTLPLPLKALAQVRKAGRLAARSAHKVNVPTLILQGHHDELARAQISRALANKLPQLAGYIEVNGGHNLLDEDDGVSHLVLHFTRRFLHQVISGEGAE